MKTNILESINNFMDVLTLDEMIKILSDFDYAFSFCNETLLNNLKWINNLPKKDFNVNNFDKLMYSKIRRYGVPYSLGYFDRRVYVLSNSYRPSNLTQIKSSGNDIVYYFKEDILCFVKSDNLYQVENNQAFAFNESNKFICGGSYESHSALNKSIFIEDGGTTQYEFYSDDNFKTGILLSLTCYSFVISKYKKVRGKWTEKKIIQYGLFPLKSAITILKNYHPYCSYKLIKLIRNGYQQLTSKGWKHE